MTYPLLTSPIISIADDNLKLWTEECSKNVNLAASRSILANSVTFASNKYAVDFDIPLTIMAGQVIYFEADAANTGNDPDVTIGGVDYTLKKADGTVIAAGVITTGLMVHAVYDGTDFRVFNV